MSIKILPATISDLNKIIELNLKLFQKEFNEFDKTLNVSWPLTDPSKKYFKERISNVGGCVFVAIIDQQEIIGYLAGGFVEPADYRDIKNPMAELENMFIDDNFRSQGIGSMLLEAFMDWCKQNNLERVKVVASFGNVLGVDFYKKNGFESTEIILEKSL